MNPYIKKEKNIYMHPIIITKINWITTEKYLTKCDQTKSFSISLEVRKIATYGNDRWKAGKYKKICILLYKFIFRYENPRKLIAFPGINSLMLVNTDISWSNDWWLFQKRPSINRCLHEIHIKNYFLHLQMYIRKKM